MVDLLSEIRDPQTTDRPAQRTHARTRGKQAKTKSQDDHAGSLTRCPKMLYPLSCAVLTKTSLHEPYPAVRVFLGCLIRPKSPRPAWRLRRRAGFFPAGFRREWLDSCLAWACRCRSWACRCLAWANRHRPWQDRCRPWADRCGHRRPWVDRRKPWEGRCKAWEGRCQAWQVARGRQRGCRVI